MVICYFCSEEFDEDFDQSELGFWCDSCDGFTYFDPVANKHKFTLILEEKGFTAKTLIEKPSIKLRKQLSPFRFPGGKSKFINDLYNHLQKGSTKKLISPFTGGGSFELALLDAGVIETLHINDLDYGVYSVWWTILYMPYTLIDKINFIKPNHKDYFTAQALIKSDFKGANPLEAAWATLLVNRLAYSGIAKANPLGGRNGTNEALLARWNPTELIKRIEHIHSMADLITITQENAVELIQEAYWNDEATIFIDPPYVAKGKDLYNCFYTERDHIELCVQLDLLHQGMPGADIVLTYDNDEWLRKLYVYPDKFIIGRTYSI